ncbi:MAG: hypothetical protein OEV49_11915 [candidate division Zixibacteria bacterium]|nr:hypothetical protein [candidate division Zixibacteria bacterium]
MDKRYHKSLNGCMAWIFAAMAMTIISTGLVGVAVGQDLTPSVNYFNFDYGAVPTSDEIDSIVAGRYEALVTDMSYGWGYVDKYNDYVLYDPDLEFYVYLDFANVQTASAAMGRVNEVVGPLMQSEGQNPENMYWHSRDYTPTGWGAYDGYNSNIEGSRLRTYGGTRPLTNNTNASFRRHFVDAYVAGIKNKHAATRNFDLTGLWFDNMGIPQDCGVSSHASGRYMYENTLGVNAQFGGENWSSWHGAYRDTVLLKYMSLLADSMIARTGMKLNINSIGWGHGMGTEYAYGYRPEYFDPSISGPVSREHEYAGTPYMGSVCFYPGPNNGATSIDSASAAADYYPGTMYKGMVACSEAEVEHWFNPSHGSDPYGFTKWHYDGLALYYLWRSGTTYLSFANDPGNNGSLNWIDGGGSGGRCVHAGMPNDSCYWLDALGERVGRDGASKAWDQDTVRWYAASVTCDDCMIAEGAGKDNAGQNWVVFMRRWMGDDAFQYMVLSRPMSTWQTTFAGSNAPAIELIDGPWQKMDHDGNWGSPISTDAFRNGEGGIYRKAMIGGCTSPPATPTLAAPGDGAPAGSYRPSLCVYNPPPVSGCNNPVIYTFELYLDPDLTVSAMAPVTVAEQSVSTCWTPLSNLEAGRVYYWRARAYNGMFNSPWAGPFSFSTPNTPPPPPTIFNPADGDTVGTLQPLLSINQSVDPNGTPVVCEFVISKFEDFSTPTATGLVLRGTSQVDWSVPVTLENGVAYYWRARSSDYIANSDWCETCLFLIDVAGNNPPSAPTVISPASGDTTTQVNPLLTVQNGSDPEGDPLTYSFEVYDAGMTVLLSSTNNVSSGAQTTSWTVSQSLAADQNYLWRARCFDGVGYSSWSASAAFTIASGQGANHPPTIPVHLLPTDGVSVSGESIQMVIENSTDIDGDSLFYDFFIYLHQSADGLVGSVRNLPETPGQTSAELPFTPVNGQTYWWRVGANDRVHWTEFTEPTSFRWVSLATDADEYIAGADQPPPGATVGSRKPTLRARNITDPGPHQYHFDVSVDSSFVSSAASSRPIDEGSDGYTEWKVDERLEPGETYFWRVRADNNAYSALSSFTVATKVFASPNPVSFRKGQVVTFHLPAKPVDLLIQSVSGEAVIIRESISGEWVWDGRNASGNSIASGVYSWFIRGYDADGKLVVKP